MSGSGGKKGLADRVKHIFANDEVMHGNEVTANRMVGDLMLVIAAMLCLCLVLNELGVFTAHREAMRITVLLCVVVAVPAIIVNRKYKGDRSWLRFTLMLDLILECALMAAVLGHNVTLVMIIPLLLSTRYYDEYYTGLVALVSVIMFFAATAACAHFGIMNLNMVHPDVGTQLTIVESLRDSVESLQIDRNAYMKSLIINEFMPRFVVYIIIVVAAVFVSKRGRELIAKQNEVSRQSERVSTELDLATKIQIGMLPCIFPAFPEMRNLDIYATSVPAKEVGGDFYDYFKIDDDHIAIVMADVSGKGVGAALFMTISKIVIKNQLQLGIELSEAITNANRQLCENNEAGLFVTTWAGVYEVSSGKLTFVNAGHNPPVIKKKGEPAEYLAQKRGFVLAGMEDTVYTQEEIKVKTGDAIFLYTDGVTEAVDLENEQYGEGRLLAFLNSMEGKSSMDTINSLYLDIMKFAGEAEQFDDVTMLEMIVGEQ